MPNMTDYLKWRGDLSFEQDPFNEVDNIILSFLSYSDFSNIVYGPDLSEKTSLEEAYKKYFAFYSREDILTHKSSTGVAPFVMDDMVNAPRYEDLYLTGYVDEIVKEEDSQFSVTTFILPDNTYYVAFRGTDSTIIGWKEDINMGYLYQTPGQKKAAKYLDDNFKDLDCKIIVGGHSKGGNFAVYASSFCDSSVQDKIIRVYSNDGPGFRKEITKMPGYKRILPKIISYVPDESIVGMLLVNDTKPIVIKSSAGGINQHNPLSWQVERNGFVKCNRLSDKSILLDETITNWLNELDDAERKRFIDSLFQPFDDAKIDSIDELGGASPDNLRRLYKSFNNLSEEQHMVLKDTATKFINSAFDTLKPKK
ncbi:MAG: DUF2974 domain-containing protein [Lachnospiraceae bacterium]|nr:DUF2974 domain-containing protein [Lachnospiraceae bacterium]